MYKELAKYYDLTYAKKDYKKEAAKLLEYIARFKQSKGNELLEVACGTGNYLQYFQKKFKCTGLDLSKEMLKEARKKVKGVKLVQGDMIDFNLKKQYDVVACLFSSISYARTYSNLKKTIKNFANHTKEGGLVIIDPFFSKEQWKKGTIHTNVFENDNIHIVRMNISEQKGNFGIFNFHYLIGEKGKGVCYAYEKHNVGLFDKEKTKEYMEDAGLKTRFYKKGSYGRGLFIGVKK